MTTEVLRHYGDSWRLRVPFVKSHLVFNLLLAAVFTPMMAGAIFLALKLSGKPALADFDIAYFLLSPVGFVAGLLLIGMVLVLLTLNLSFMMAVALRDRVGKSHGLWDGIDLVMPRLPAVLGLAVQIALRLLALAVPFLAVAGLAFWYWLSAYDINYYLSTRPPEFQRAVLVIAATLAVMAGVMLWRSLGWVLSLPLVLFESMAPADAIRESKGMMTGKRMAFAVQIIAWALIGALVSALVLGLVAFGLQAGLHMLSENLRATAAFLLVSVACWSLLNLLLTSWTTGALAVTFLDAAEWPDSKAERQALAPRGLLIAVVAVAAGSAGLGGAGVLELARVDQTRPVAVIAHRGAAGARPENTMASVMKAIEDQADWIEIDVQETVDGAVVVMHDSDFMKLAGNPIKIWDATLADLEEIDIGSWYDPAFATERVPLLRDVLLAAKDKAGVIIELKYYGHDQQLEQRVVDIVEETGMVEQVQLMSLKYDAVQKMHGLRPEWSVGLLASAALGNMWKLDADFLAVNSATVSLDLVKSAQAVGKPVYVWTVNDALSMSGMLSLGVDGLITDEPALARQVLAERKTLSGIERAILGMAGRIGLDLPEQGDEDA
ncbi:glycerophosphodiester phosphodiesterase family protein [Shimia sp.]|uniref:glycerophosphodiester phosphodiesterase family protein n=1 Tax=Shimia sp. TaxID=1954381 RepID=UPI003BA94360